MPDDDDAHRAARMEAARRAGWNPDDGDPPFVHGLPPEVDPELGHNGIPPTSAPRVS